MIACRRSFGADRLPQTLFAHEGKQAAMIKHSQLLLSLFILILAVFTVGCGNDPIANVRLNCEKVCNTYEQKTGLMKKLKDEATIRNKISEIRAWCDQNDSENNAFYKSCLACRGEHLEEAKAAIASYSPRWEKAHAVNSNETERVRTLFDGDGSDDDEAIYILLNTRFGLDTNPFQF